MRARLIGFASLALLSVAPAPATGQQVAPRSTSFISYDEFISLSAEAQLPRFAGLTADNQSHLVRTHAERWLLAHRDELSASQIQVVEEAIAFIRPELYAKPATTDLAEQQGSHRQRLACSLGRDRTRQAFMLTPRDSPPAPVPEPSLIDVAIDRVLAWFSDCVMPR